ncbi:hypothetical protein [Candidatus Desulforudis audaxviator]|uniref:Uncharacterized protein n=1 Tax=Desulforudis audaxviator (strain MP104C) TaxID=477974 RepID=B1I397_DESAP|nr:hypothetical protein [Candidatus Desulforudis audaxviator]ACA59451.1 conserved hypothetical protein [Candidatus Desulforudis audaxviator MP104C]AZK59433.1 hypothetical protein Daudx_0880 [Candidatus Desulforudis audaxviator]
MITATLLFLLTLALIAFSIRERIKLQASRFRSHKSWELEPRATPLSEAVLNLIGIAGGVYLALIMLFTFLEVSLPNKISLGGVEVEPLAAFAIGLAIVQPFILRLWEMIRERLRSQGKGV